MNDNMVLEGEYQVPGENLETPAMWNYDKETGKLVMITVGENNVPHVEKTRAIIGENNGFFRIATLENSRQVCLFNDNRRRHIKVNGLAVV